MCHQESGGSVWSIGRSEYGRLGLGEEGARDAKVAEQVDISVCTGLCYTQYTRWPSWRGV